ncbi:MAG: YlmC/YmxH family sporulation protein [Clostridia bacterium]|nr:YlmC/YmxH family sporulation protein [Clostridia bacterium]
MANCTCTALREKEVINLCDGRRLGYVCDVELSLCDGKLTAIMVPAESGLFGFCRCPQIVIPWEKIETIGNDAILVRLSPAECCPQGTREKRGPRIGPFQG